MRKSFFVAMAVLAVMLMMFISTAMAETFEAPKGAEAMAVTIGEKTTITVSGIPDAVFVEQYRVTKKDPINRYPLDKGPVVLNPYDGDRIQVVNRKGEWLYLTPEMAASRHPKLKLVGLEIECSNPPKGCTLQIQ